MHSGFRALETIELVPWLMAVLGEADVNDSLRGPAAGAVRGAPAL